MQAMAFGFTRLTLNGVIRFQIVDNNEHKEFCMPEDHPILLRETTALLIDLHTPKTAA